MMLSLDGWVDPNTGETLDPEWLQKLINRQLPQPVKIGGHVRAVDYSFNPVDMGLKGKKNRADPSDLGRLVVSSTANVSVTTSDATHRRLAFDMIDPLLLPGGVPLQFDPDSMLLQPTMEMSCMGKTVEFPLATYMMAAPRSTSIKGVRTYSFQGLDLSNLIAIADLISDWTIVANYAGSNGISGHIGGLLDLIHSDSVPKSIGGAGSTPQNNDDAGPGIPLSMIDFDVSGNQAVGVPLTWQPGTNRLGTCCADICSAINYYPLHVGALDFFTLRRIPDWSVDTPSASWDFSTTGHSILGTQITEDFDTSQRTNLVKVAGGQATASGGSTFTALVVNQDPTDRLSFANLRNLSGRPRAIPKYVANPNLANQAMANLSAQLTLNFGNAVQRSTSTTTRPVPITESFELYVMNVTNPDGSTLIGSDVQHMFLELGWSMPFMSDGDMQHDLIQLFAL